MDRVAARRPRGVGGSFQIADRKLFLEQTVLLVRNLSNFFWSDMGWLDDHGGQLGKALSGSCCSPAYQPPPSAA